MESHLPEGFDSVACIMRCRGRLWVRGWSFKFPSFSVKSQQYHDYFRTILQNGGMQETIWEDGAICTLYILYPFIGGDLQDI